MTIEDFGFDINDIAWEVEKFKLELSIANLNTSIYLFCQVLNGLSVTHTLYCDAINHLAFALSVRYMYTGDIVDLEEALSHYEIIATIALPSSPNWENATTNVSQYKHSCKF